jgi:hypothetical protein
MSEYQSQISSCEFRATNGQLAARTVNQVPVRVIEELDLDIANGRSAVLGY